MRIAVYTPYLDTFGGGERYMLTIAEVLSNEHLVDLLIPTHLANSGTLLLKEKLAKHLNLNLSQVNVVLAPIGKGANFIERLLFFKKYDLLFFLTDGSIFYSTAKKNILHIQTPLKNESLNNFWNKIKLSSFNLIIYNSKFTQQNISKFWPVKSRVIYPPVAVDQIKPLKKKNYILSVGRFFGYLKEKKHQLMIKTFSELISKHKLGWSLHLVGSASDGDKSYLEDLKKRGKGKQIFFYPNLEFNKLIKLYGESKIYWHAMGFNEEDPTKMEHFGITTVEAMAGGCVPIVINKGGLKEIVDHNKNGFLWNDLNEWQNLTMQIIENEKLREKLAQAAVKKSQFFSKDKFSQEIKSLIDAN